MNPTPNTEVINEDAVKPHEVKRHLERYESSLKAGFDVIVNIYSVKQKKCRVSKMKEVRMVEIKAGKGRLIYKRK